MGLRPLEKSKGGGLGSGAKRGRRHTSEHSIERERLLLHLLPPQERTVSNENIIIDVEVENKHTVSNGWTCCCTCC